MRFAEYLATLPAPPKDAERLDKAARRRGERDPIGTPRRRLMATRLVEEAELIVGALDYPEEKWPIAIANLCAMGRSDWKGLANAKDLVKTPE